MIGSTVSHYRIIERLGEGGMGEVFLAEDIRLRRRVALKLLRRRAGEEGERSRLLAEARAASALNHPGIAVIYDIDEIETPAGRTTAMAMEYVAGKTFSELAAASSMGLDEILGLVGQAADALAEAHAHGVVHGDVKPSNLMVSQGRVKILDFGLARMHRPVPADDRTLTRDIALRDGEFAGTPHYMSPEQALGRPIDARSDLFSLGVILYELLAGKRPFDGENVVQLADAILHREMPPLPARWIDPRMPEIERLLARMLAKDPAARPPGLRDVGTQIFRLRAGDPAALAFSGALTVAIAGFANITGRAEDEWLGTGLAETVTAALQEIEGLEIWSPERLRESLRRLGAAGELEAEDAVQLGRMTGARWVLAGGFQRSGDQVRVTVRVVEVESGRVVRALRKDGRIESIFSLQDEIVAELLAGLRTSVVAAHEGEETQIVAAYEALSKGLLNMRSLSYESLDRAILLFERALELDPDYVRAQVELGAAYATKADYLSSPELHERGAAILRRVLESRPRLPRACRELGHTLIARNQVDDGMECLHRALSLAPDDSYILGGMARGLFIGRADFRGAADYFGKAVERNPEAGWYWLQLAHCRALLREFAPSETAARRAIELQEEFLSGQQGVRLVGAHMRLGHVLSLQGRFPEAIDAFTNELLFGERLDHALRSRIRIELHLRLGMCHLSAGDEAPAGEALEEALEAFAERLSLGADDPFTRYYAAAIHALRGEKDDALALLESSAAVIPAFVLARARIEPEWDGLRTHPRFVRLLARNAA